MKREVKSNYIMLVLFTVPAARKRISVEPRPEETEQGDTDPDSDKQQDQGENEVGPLENEGCHM